VISCVNINDKTVRAQDIAKPLRRIVCCECSKQASCVVRTVYIVERPRATLGTWSSSLVALFPPEEGGQVFEDEDI
jgi:hypothetical protein